jgi:hypothetical protein
MVMPNNQFGNGLCTEWYILMFAMQEELTGQGLGTSVRWDKGPIAGNFAHHSRVDVNPEIVQGRS